MAEAFNPDKFLAETAPSAAPASGFNPDKFLEETAVPQERPWYSLTGEGIKQGFMNMLPHELPGQNKQPTADDQTQKDDRPWYSMSADGLKQGALDAIPALGMVGGAAAGFLGGGPVGGVIGAGAGGVAGQSLKSTIKSASQPKGTYDLFPGGKHEEDKTNTSPTREEYYNDLLNAGKSGLLSEVGGQMAGSVLGGAAKIAKGAASELSGVSQKEIENYAARADEVNQLAKEHQLDGKFDSLGAVNSMRDDVLGDVRSEIANQHKAIGKALDGASAIPKFSVQPIKRVLEDQMSKLDPIYQGGDIKAIQGILAKIDQKAPGTTGINLNNMPFTGGKKITLGGPTSVQDTIKEAEKVYPKQEQPGIPSWGDIGNKIKATISQLASGVREAEPAAVDKSLNVKVPGTGENPVGVGVSKYHGYMSVQDAQATKNFLYKIASGSYPNDEFFQVGPKVANAAKMAGRAAKEMLDKGGPPEIVAANGKLERLHEIEESLSPNILNTNKPASKMLSVGTGENQLDTKALSELGLLTGKDYIQNARDISTARTFANPKMFPQQTTGRSLLGPKIGGIVGGAAGGLAGGWPGIAVGTAGGAGLGGLLSSPYAIKTAIDMAPAENSAMGLLGRTVPKGLLYEKLKNEKANEH